MTKMKPYQLEGIPGAFFSGAGQPVSAATRLPGRAFFGLGYQHNQGTDGNVTGGSWLQSFGSEGLVNPVTEWDYHEDQARVVSVSDFGTAISGATRTTGGTPAIAVAANAVASAANGHPAWGSYTDSVRAVSGAGNAIAAEINAAQLAETSPGNAGITEFGRLGSTPYKAEVAGITNVLRLGAGSDAAVFGRSYAVDAAITIIDNGAPLWSGIVFRHNALMREGVADDRSPVSSSGYARAIEFAHNQGLSWYAQNPSGVAGTQEEVFRISSTILDSSVMQGLFFNDAGMDYRERSGAGASLFRVNYRNDASSNIVVGAGAAGVSPRLGVEGAATNIPLIIAPKGTGGLVLEGGLRDFADDTAAAAGTPPIPVNGLYRTGSIVKIRVA